MTDPLGAWQVETVKLLLKKACFLDLGLLPSGQATEGGMGLASTATPNVKHQSSPHPSEERRKQRNFLKGFGNHILILWK